MKTNKIWGLLLVLVSFVHFGNGQDLFPVFKGHNSGKHGYIDNQGELKIPFKYASAGHFQEGLAVVSTDYGKSGYIRKNGTYAIPEIYDKANPFENGYALVKKGDQYLIIDQDGEEYLIPNLPRSYEVEVSDKGLLEIKVNRHSGFVNLKNEVVIPAIYLEAGPFKNGWSIAKKDSQFGDVYVALTRSGKEVPLEGVQSARDFSGGLLAVRNKDRKWGFMNEDLELVIDYQFKEVGDFHHGYAVFHEGKKKGYINDRGVKVVPAKYRQAQDFSDGRGVVLTDEYDAVIFDQDLKEIARFEDIAEGVTRNFSYHNGICMLHLATKPNPRSKDPLIRDWGGVITICINKEGKIIWKSDEWYSCFPGDALVRMGDGGSRAISKLEAGDLILTFDPLSETEKQVSLNALQVHEGTFEILEISFEATTNMYAGLEHGILNAPLRVTPNHPVMTSEGVREAGTLRPQDWVYCYNELNGQLEKRQVLHVARAPGQQKVYNLDLDADFYFVEGMLVKRK
ncbi:MAG: hypothetical protein EP338_04195 [Bacteroidetes bacterium]|nr:MAG: hypothetical protein EP338_04195 [Bacteroidota bacterium]